MSTISSSRMKSPKNVTINTHKGLYRYTRLPFGITTAPAVSHRIRNTILQGIERLEEVLKHLQHGLHVKNSKYRFLQPNVILLGHRIDAERLHPTKEKLKAIVEAPAPNNIWELKSFLDLINYGKFIPNAATILAPLDVLRRRQM